MSRSNPTANNPNPSTRWFEWKGSDGKLVSYDKETKSNIEATKAFRFLVLDQLSTVTGYNSKARCGVTSNEVRNSVTDVMVVKYFDGRPIAHGLWNSIKKDVAFEKGKFAKSVYIAFKDGEELKIGNIRMSGSSLGPWFDFCKEHGDKLNTHAVSIKPGSKDTTGDVEFIPPVFTIVETTPETNEKAVELDVKLQEFLKAYIARTGMDNVDQRTGQEEEPEEPSNLPPARTGPPPKRPPADPDLDELDPDIPF